MRHIAPPPRVEQVQERLDGEVPIGQRARSLADVARLNAVFGGRRLTLRALRRLVAALPRHRQLTVLDVGTGGADIPRAIARWARRAGRRIRVLALDHDRDTLAIARGHLASYPEITPMLGDALALPIASGRVDVVVSSLTLHHLEPAEATRALGEMAAAARVGVAVNDLARSRHGVALVWLVTRVLARSRLSRHDGPLSVRRAYTAAETLRLCEKAGVFDARVRRHPLLLRYTATWSAVRDQARRSRPGPAVRGDGARRAGEPRERARA
jgi:SAM-dependent methyltransferase